MSNKTAIIIPARYASTRFPGKPLAKICGQEMLLRVWNIANIAAQDYNKKHNNVSVYIATDDKRIEDFCTANNLAFISTSEACKTGTDRIIEAANKLPQKPDFVVNLQGDNPLCPPSYISEIIKYFNNNPKAQVVTPVTQLSWTALDELRQNKQTTPFSGTTAVLDKNGDAMFFSKNIIPAIRKEEKHKAAGANSPVLKHIGLYGYGTSTLEQIAQLNESHYEPYEGLEQLRFLENGIKIACVKVKAPSKEGLAAIGGVDSPEDLTRAEAAINKYGEEWYKD